MPWRRLSLLLCLNVLCVKCGCINIFLNADHNDRSEMNRKTYHIDVNPSFFSVNLNEDIDDDMDDDDGNSKQIPMTEMPVLLRKPEIHFTKLNIPISRHHHTFMRTTMRSPTISIDYTTTRPMQMENSNSNSISNSNEKFNGKLYEILSRNYQRDSLIYSPISIQSILAIVYFGAEFNTAKQLQIGLDLPSSRQEVLYQFQQIVKESQQSTNNFQLEFVQKIYFKNDIVLRYSIKDIAINYFNSEITPISFDTPSTAAEEINNWVDNKTHNRIKQIINPDTLDDDTSVILINAIYMKAQWLNEFSKSDTLKQEFFIDNEAKTLSIDMMYIEDDFKYGEFSELNAKIIELPFMDSELSMIIILPNERDGLTTTQNLIKKYNNLNQFLNKMKTSAVTLRMPKFKIESDFNMESPLQQLGIHDIFTENAKLGKLFSNPNVRISKIQHKAFINVNEGGLEAAAATFVQLVPLSLEPNMIYFTADHPFIFAIRSPLAVYFSGHVINNFQ